MTARSETILCPICDTEDRTVLHEDDGWSMTKCGGCGLVYQNPRLTMDHLREVDYDGVTQERESFFGRDLDRTGLEDWLSQPLAAYEAGVAAVDAQRDPEAPRGVWLDVGASTGALLVAAKNAGYEPTGVELGSGQVRVCREVHGFDVRHATLGEAAFPDAHADVISYRHVLEHVHDVRGDLAEAKRVLKPDGHLLIEVPNYGGVRYSLGRLRKTIGLTKEFWQRLNVPEHIYYFTIDSLRQLLALEGFEVIWWGTYGKTRRKTSWLQRTRMQIRDGMRIGNKLRVVARPTAPSR